MGVTHLLAVLAALAVCAFVWTDGPAAVWRWWRYWRPRHRGPS